MINQTISHYKIQERLGEGGMGVVYKALDTRLDRPVALKFISEELARDPQALERFRLEARAASALNHPQICTIYDIGEHNGQPFIVMEYLEGQSLKERIVRSAIPTSELLDISIQIAGALEAAHARGIVHRDIKPANIFLTTQGQVKILDFGLAKLAPKEAGVDVSTTAGAGAFQTVAGTTLGTVAYMSPEQARAEDVDARSDLFSLGVVLYEMATGQQAFSGNSLALVYDSLLNREPASVARLNTSIPPQLDYTIEKAIEKDRKLRYQHCSEIRADLERIRRDIVTGRSSSVQVRDFAPAVPAPGPSPAPVTMYASREPIQLETVEAAERARDRNPKRAFMLGFIPGVGALYNGDYQKAAVHIFIFAMLTALEKYFDGAAEVFFSYLRLGFWAYMAFDSYHAAKKLTKS